MLRYLLLVVCLVLLQACEQNTQSKTSGSGTQGFKQPYSKMLVYPNKKALAEFELTDHSRQVFSGNQFNGRWNLIFMGFTNCPDVCPTTLMDINLIYQDIAADLQPKFQVIFLSVDPKRDNPQHLADYISHFNDDFVGISGNKPEIDKLVGSLGGIYSINDEDENYYTVDHTARIFIVDPQGRRYGIISSEAMHDKDKTQLVKELSHMASSAG